MTPQRLVKAGVSPVLAIIWLFMLLFTGSWSVGFLLNALFYKGLGLATYKLSMENFGDLLSPLLIADIVFYALTYVLFLRKPKT